MCAVCGVKGGLRELVLVFRCISFQIIFLCMHMLGGAAGEVVVGLELRSLACAPPGAFPVFCVKFLKPSEGRGSTAEQMVSLSRPRLVSRMENRYKEKVVHHAGLSCESFVGFQVA